MHRFRILWALPTLLFPFCIAAQSDLIHFVNPSFEDLPKSGEAPVGWYDCGDARETPPDIQPGSFQVSKLPADGDTYLGLVVRDNDTWEAVAQRLSRPLTKGNCYELSMFICRSELYISLSRTTGQQTNYATPAKLMIWGGNGFCDKRELLYESPDITHDRWLKYDLRLEPKKGNYTHILFEAYYRQPTLFAYNGNILLDNLSAINELECNLPPMSEPFASNEPENPGKKVSTKTKTNPKPPSKPATTTKSPPKTKPTIVETRNMGNQQFKKGDIIRIEKLYFDADQYEIKPGAEEALHNVLTFLMQNPGVVVEVGGHTNNRAAEEFALELSTNRAKAVAAWLVERGIPDGRVKYKGYGWKMPVASNLTEEGRSRNQRVEIKILSTDG